MPARVPIFNSKFSNAPDFNNLAVTGITGSGVFRSFNYLYTGSTSRTLQNSDLWTTIEVTGNCIITISDNSSLGASVGDEIIIVNPAGFTSFIITGGARLLSPSTIVLAERPARLIYLGTVPAFSDQTWILSGLKTYFTQNTPTDCCGNNLSPVYTLGDFSVSSVAYADANATSLYTSSNIGNVVLVDGTGYTITSGVVTETPCSEVSFTYLYTFYDNGGVGVSLYTCFDGLDINIDAEITNVPFKTTTASGPGVYICNTTGAVNGTYYRGVNMYGPYAPVCFTNGIITSFSSC
jgi:hypothetical protein